MRAPCSGGAPECAALSADIAAISRMTAESIVPARPRDFRLTPAQAASARGGVLERLGRWLSSPRGAIVRPLAGATLAIGLVLVAVGPSIRQPLAPEPAPPVAGAEASAAAPDATADPALFTTEMMVGPSADPAGISETGPSTMSDRSSATDAVGAAPVAKATAERRCRRRPNAGGADRPAPDAGRDNATGASRSPTADDTSKALTLLGIVLAGTAALVLLLTWLARRMTRHELLP